MAQVLRRVAIRAVARSDLDRAEVAPEGAIDECPAGLWNVQEDEALGGEHGMRPNVAVCREAVKTAVARSLALLDCRAT
jgi:hypothetical protein